MQEVIKFLYQNPMGFLATVENGEPRVRPFGFMLEEDGKFYFCTSCAKNVYRQLTANPEAEFSTVNSALAWLRLRGRIVFTEDLKLKEKILTASELVKSIYQRADNPVFKVFYIERGSAVIADFSGQPPQCFVF
jgi:uncharacterized pyridoxamine 5'-phosphate oxidase family protein